MIGHLPEHLRDRVRPLNVLEHPRGDGPVVVWLKSSFRTHENPAIDVGRHIAAKYNLPLVIYHGLDERYPFASLRHHNMILDAAVDMNEGCMKLGLRYVFHLAREGHRPSVMRSFAEDASCIVTDMFPLPPWTAWVETIARSASCPVVDVDCHCVIPMPLYGKSVDRPFKFRNATKKMRKRRVQSSWPTCRADARPYEGPLPFEPVDVQSVLKNPMERFALLRTCNIDPTVHPVWQERGGEHAALSKWQGFLSNGLNGYARRRNNAADPTGVSRLSYAFHYGFLSPMRVAREAAAIGTKSADKYLDELLIFREHAWHHIYSVSEPYSPSNLPSWAQESWRSTADDPRTVLPHPVELEHAKSPSELWNLCQRSLIHHGELHNNLRMTWGKALPIWTNDLETSLELGQKLNDKYALDGRDPSSVVGVQWCHGLFDRPFFPSMPVMGVVRKRDILTHKSRLDVERYESHVNRHQIDVEGVYLVVGYGILECLIARMLHDKGFNVYVVKPEQHQPEYTLQADGESKWLGDYLESIYAQIGTSAIQEVTSFLASGIPILDTGEVHISVDEPLVRPALVLNGHQQLIECIATVDDPSIPSPLQSVLEYDNGSLLCQLHSPPHGQRNDRHRSELETAVWNLSEHLWQKSVSKQPATYSVQMKLV